MSVIVELSLPADAFELDRILRIEGHTKISLETMVPLGEQSVPFFRLYGSARESFERVVSEHAAVGAVHEVNTHGEETLYGLEWDIGDDEFFNAVLGAEGNLLEATGDPDTWGFELRFPTHDALSEFQETCIGREIPIDVVRIYNPTKPDAGPWYGLTVAQRETLTRAVEAGYYSIPRETATRNLAAEFDISDQAVTERLRRAIRTMVMNTLLLSE